MKDCDFVSSLGDRLSSYVTFKTLGGVDAGSQMKLLSLFDRFLASDGFKGPWPTREAIDRYTASTEHLHPGTRGNRLAVVRQFCLYLRQFKPDCYVPERILSLERRPKRVPHIYTDGEIKRMLEAARGLRPSGSLRPGTFYTLFGLLHTTGLRCGEAFALDLQDVDLEKNLIFVRKGKFGKSRWVPITSSTSAALGRYREARIRAYPPGEELPLFVTTGGRRMYHTNADSAFREILFRCGLRARKGSPGPRMHDLRHGFACTRLLRWYREGKDVNALLAPLATYLGHVNVTSTQIYLQATAELLGEAGERFLSNFRKNILQKEEEK